MNRMLLWPQGAPLSMGEPAEAGPALHLFPADGPEPAGAVIVCPGGGYGFRAEHEGAPVAEWLNSLGIHAFVLDYRVHPYRHPAPLLDAQRAIRLVRSQARAWNVRPDRVGILGFSAGGHLASTAGTRYDLGTPHAADPIDRESCRPDAMVLCYPVITMGESGHLHSRENLLGPDADPQLIEALSSERHVTEDTPPAFLWHTSEDDVKVEHSLQFALSLSRKAIPFDLHVYDKGPHGLGLATSDPYVGGWTTQCGKWLKKLGF
ncbi:alpha/beta hydrolase [Paenibacillus thiaminolyticus]|uniref:alpha/beta hydrolase n=1 Tax=Paenibacillus thiaminolyticus TaxID=49283 RepID=UPI0035A70755